MVSPGFLLSLWIPLLPQTSVVAQTLAEGNRPPAATLGLPIIPEQIENTPITMEQIKNTPPEGWPQGMPLPSGAFSWDFLGDFRLTNGGPEQQVKLYTHDMCSLANRIYQRMGGVGKG